jgi:hypothetical protein
MSTLITGRSFKALFVAGLLALTVSGASQAAADTADESRSSISRHYAEGGRDNPTFTSESTDDFEALVKSGTRSKLATSAGVSKLGSGAEATQSVGNDFWFYDVDVDLFADDDNDGYFHGIDVLFDADTIYSSAEVYAVLYLSLDFGPWNEYGQTEDFWLFGSSADDDYVLVTELMSGYPTGDYDLLIELFDAGNNSFLASFGPDDSSALSFLSLEDFHKDEPIIDRPVAVSHGGGGAADTWTISILLLLLVASAARKIWRRRNDALIRIDTPASAWNVPTNIGRF